MTVTSVAVATTKFLFGMCVDSDVGTVDFSLVLEILHVCGNAGDFARVWHRWYHDAMQ